MKIMIDPCEDGLIEAHNWKDKCEVGVIYLDDDKCPFLFLKESERILYLNYNDADHNSRPYLFCGPLAFPVRKAPKGYEITFIQE